MGLLNPKNPNAVLNKKSIFAFVYGEPGIGKTALAFSAGRTYLFDCDDEGSIRAKNRGHVTDVVEDEASKQDLENPENGITVAEFFAAVKNKQIVREIKSATGKEVDTIIIDNVASLYNMLLESKKKSNPSLAKNNLKLYGEAKTDMCAFIKSLKKTGKNIIILIHVKLNDAKAKPDGSDSLVNIITAICDVYARMSISMEAGQQVRHISFDPDEDGFGKNAGNLPKMRIPELHKLGNWFMEKVIKPTLEVLNSKSISEIETIEKIDSFCSTLILCNNADEVNVFINELSLLKEENEGAYTIIRNKLKQKIANLPIVLNAETKQYEDVSPAN
ncbi:MAG TPA: AAA family ATPase [Pyrinomonadaceae bacterium]|nr:AAA family ATPase [Pyrinomonadaceae bacterium]